MESPDNIPRTFTKPAGPVEDTPTTMGARAALAAVIPVGPSPVDTWRAVQTISSLLRWEPALRWCVFLDDSPTSRGLEHLRLIPPTCTVVAIANPLRGPRLIRLMGGLACGMLKALSWIQAHTSADLILKIDIDALVIAPFADNVRRRLATATDIGVVGAFGTCNPALRHHYNFQREPRVLRARRLWPTVSEDEEGGEESVMDIPTFGLVTREQRRALDRLRSHVDAAIAHGFSTNEDCQGGAYAVARVMLDRMAANGYFSEADAWSTLPIGEDRVMAMYARAVGLELLEFSGPGEPFGVQPSGLAYPPQELAARGYGVIHSIKNDPVYSEAFIREYFQEPRADGP